MAEDVHKIITLKIEEVDNEKNKTGIVNNEDNNKDKQEVERRLNGSTAEDNMNNLKKMAGGAIVINTSKQVVQSAINNHISSIGQRTGRNEYGERVAEAYSTASNAVATATTVGVAFSVSRIAGVVTLAMTAISKVFNYIQNQKQQGYKTSEETITQSFTAIRSGNINSRKTS